MTMAKFRFYITDLNDGRVKGTNNESIAASYAYCEDFFVVDSEAGKWIAGNEILEVEEIDAVEK